jgi:hypothetical protein
MRKGGEEGGGEGKCGRKRERMTDNGKRRKIHLFAITVEGGPRK